MLTKNKLIDLAQHNFNFFSRKNCVKFIFLNHTFCLFVENRTLTFKILGSGILSPREKKKCLFEAKIMGVSIRFASSACAWGPPGNVKKSSFSHTTLFYKFKSLGGTMSLEPFYSEKAEKIN